MVEFWKQKLCSSFLIFCTIFDQIKGNSLNQSYSTHQTLTKTISTNSTPVAAPFSVTQRSSRIQQQQQSKPPVIRHASSVTDTYYTSQQQEPAKSIRTSTHVIPDQGSVPLMQVNRKNQQKTCQSFQQITPTYQRSKSYDDEPESNKFREMNFTVETNESHNLVNRPNYYGSLSSLPQQRSPRFTKEIQPMLTRRAGQPVKLEFELADCPDASVTWLKDGMHVYNTPHTRINSKFGVHTLIIPEAFPEDAGHYKVLINSPLGDLDTSCELIVEGFFIFLYLYKHYKKQLTRKNI